MIPRDVLRVLEEGVLCSTAAPTDGAPHLTPVVFALERERVWATTARRSRKAGIWRERPHAGGLVRAGGRAITFGGAVDLYDALDPFTWPRSVLESPTLALAALRFSAKNARFFAGYARDAHRVPLGWTPPGRVFLSLGLEEGALLDLREGRVVERWGRPQGEASGRERFRRLPGRPPIDAGAPPALRGALGEEGSGALAVGGPDRPVVLPVRWRRADDEGAFYAALPEPLLALAGAPAEFPAALVLDRASAWRASQMLGLQLRGPAQAFLPARLRSGAASLAERLGGVDPGEAVVRLRPDRGVWWRGWSTGSLVRR